MTSGVVLLMPDPSSILGSVWGGGATVTIALLFAALSFGYRSDLSPVLDRILSMLPITFVYITLTGVGVVFQADSTTWTRTHWLSVVTGFVSMSLAHWGQWFINDLTDTDTDQFSNADRPLSQGTLTERQALVAGLTMMAFGTLFGGVVRLEAAFAIFAWVGVAMVYTLPPLRLKDGAYSGMICFGLLGTVAILFGSLLISETPTQQVWLLVAVLLVVIPLNSSYQDLPDEEGDARAGIDNFVVRYGSDRISRFLAVTFPLSFAATAAVFGWYLALPAFAGLGLAVTYLLMTWDGGDEIDPQVSSVIGLFFILLAVSEFLW